VQGESKQKGGGSGVRVFRKTANLFLGQKGGGGWVIIGTEETRKSRKRPACKISLRLEIQGEKKSPTGQGGEGTSKLKL